MCHTKTKIVPNWNDDKSYYPGIPHSPVIEMELEEYIWSIHDYIDLSAAVTKMKRNIIDSAGIPNLGVTDDFFVPVRNQ